MAHTYQAHQAAISTERMPMAVAKKVSLFEREIRVRLSSAVEDILLEGASVLSEGKVDGDLYFGSTMMTIDLSQARTAFSEACDAATAKRVVELFHSDQRYCNHVKQLGAREARRLSSKQLDQVQVDLRVRRSGQQIHLDMDVEATCKVIAF